MNAKPQIEMFEVTTYEPPLRDNRDVMEYPFLSLQKGRRKPIEYTSPDGSKHLHVTAPDNIGIANIWDWDLIVYATAHINDAVENEYVTSPWIKFAPYDALKYMRKGTSGRHYKELVQSIRRLNSTSIITSIRTNDTDGFEGNLRWLQNYRIPKKYKQHAFIRSLDDGEPDSGVPWAIELAPWLYNSILRRSEVLAVHPDYFKLTGGLERWLYRLARKAVPENADFPGFSFRMETLHKRSGSSRPLRKFAFDVRKIAERQGLPEYDVVINRDGRHELVTLMHNKTKPRRLPRGVKRLFNDA